MNGFQKRGVYKMQATTSTADARKLLYKICRNCTEHNRASGCECDQCPIQRAYHSQVDTIILLSDIEREIAVRKMQREAVPVRG